MGVQQLEEIFTHARMNFHFPHKIVGVGSNDIKVELLERRISCGFLFIVFWWTNTNFKFIFAGIWFKVCS